MHRKPLIWKLFPIYFLITLVSVSIIGLYASNVIRDFYYAQVQADLQVRSRLIAQDVLDQNLLGDEPKLAGIVHSLAKASETRVTVISPIGRVIADSESDPKHMENHADRPEFKQAMQDKIGKSRRKSPTIGVTMVYVAVPLRDGGKTIGVLRTAVAATALDAAPVVTSHRIIMLALLTAAFAGLVSYLAARRVSEPLKKMKRAAARFAGGDLQSPVPSPDTEEFASLAEALNRMANRLGIQMKTITQHATEQRAILSSMKEGVVAIDNDDRVLILNPMAEQILSVTLANVQGKTVQEAIRNPELQRFFTISRGSAAMVMDEFTLRGDKDVLVQATGSSLVDEDGKEIGAVVVLNDITQTRKLESLRKDFVANVSHELKTPITSIKGFVETLREGAADDAEARQEFLDIVARQADRLQAIIEDLLSLSRIEQEAETGNKIALNLYPIADVLTAAIADCSTKAANAGVVMSLECKDDLAAMFNPPLLEQTVTNLLDNAIKYAPGGCIRITAERADREVIIRVIDNGIGIDSEHIPRLFERFYRVDKARSRKMGGTGLGLAIVKHIVQAHRGRIDVQSEPGQGSTFSISLPLPEQIHLNIAPT